MKGEPKAATSSQTFKRSRPVSAEMSVRKRPGLVTWGRATLLEDYEKMQKIPSLMMLPRTMRQRMLPKGDDDGFQTSEEQIQQCCRAAGGEKFSGELCWKGGKGGGGWVEEYVLGLEKMGWDVSWVG